MHETSEAGVRVDAAGELSSVESKPSWTRKMNHVHFLQPLHRRKRIDHQRHEHGKSPLLDEAIDLELKPCTASSHHASA